MTARVHRLLLRAASRRYAPNAGSCADPAHLHRNVGLANVTEKERDLTVHQPSHAPARPSAPKRQQIMPIAKSWLVLPSAMAREVSLSGPFLFRSGSKDYSDGLGISIAVRVPTVRGNCGSRVWSCTTGSAFNAFGDDMTHDSGISQEVGSLDQARYSAEQKADVHAMLEAILDRLDGLQRGPDPWDETCLVHALHFMESRLYARARSELDSCILPAGERPSWRAKQANKNPQRYTVARLRTRFEGVRAANK